VSKIVRPDKNVGTFAQNATGYNRTVFGETTQSDDLTENLSEKFLKGWEIVNVNEAPTKQDFNAGFFTLSKLTAYLYQAGIPEWNVHQEYHADSVTIHDGVIYQSLADNNIGNNPGASSEKWRKIIQDYTETPDATETVKGKAAFATLEEAREGIIDNKIMSPAQVKDVTSSAIYGAKVGDVLLPVVDGILMIPDMTTPGFEPYQTVIRSSEKWTAPYDGVYEFELWGGGGSGGGGGMWVSELGGGGGGGGGSGYYVRDAKVLMAQQTYNVVIGEGGVYVDSTSVNGKNGGFTDISALGLRALGGNGGYGGGNGGDGGGGGIGGIGGVNGSNGGNGSYGYLGGTAGFSSIGGGGGGGGRNVANYGNGGGGATGYGDWTDYYSGSGGLPGAIRITRVS
jgi:hypothetical protein